MTTPVYEVVWVHITSVPALLRDGWEYAPSWSSGDPDIMKLRRVIGYSTSGRMDVIGAQCK